jgi:ABC-type transport system substrate-binding protein
VQLPQFKPKAHTGFRFVSLLVLLSMILTACAVPAAPAANAPAAGATEAPAASATEAPAAASGADNVTVYGTKLPDDAVPYSQQVLHEACDNTANQTTFDFEVSVYTRYCGADFFQDQLVTLDKDFNIIPSSAEKWEVSSDGLNWTFHIKPGLQWSDGTPLTANDWVATFRYEADPAHAWDFAWFYAGVLQNWDEIVAGTVTSDTLGVKAVDDLTLQLTTKVPWPALPAQMEYSFVLQKHALETYGPYYNNDPKTSVSAGPFMLDSIEPGNQITLVANPHYKGIRQPRLSKIIYTYMSSATYFAAFQKGDIDHVGYEALTPANFETILADPVMSKNYLRHYGDFRTDYLVMDTFNPPFNDVKVRKAFANAIDRDSIVKNVYGEIKAEPAHSFLMPGFPASDTDGTLKGLQGYDCDAAKKDLADAGFPDGKGFPPQEMWLRNEAPALQAVFQAVAASISDCLGVQIQVSNKDYKVYMDSLNAKPTKLTFGAISYGMDYLDPSNMLGIWLSTGRHSWKNDDFDRMIKEASSMVGDPAKRTQEFKDAEKILVDDVGGIFIDHRWQGDLVQPYLQGEGFRQPDSQGIAAFHWGNDWVVGTEYIAKH